MIPAKTEKVAKESTPFEYPSNMRVLCAVFEMALRDLVDQVEKGNLVDDHGHDFRMNVKFIKAMDVLKA